MKLYSKILTSLTAAFVGVATLAIAFGGTASADCFQYNASGFNTSSTPVFNNICGVPELGNESDFVRIRQSATNTAIPTNDEAVDPTYSVGSINAACNDGDLFDVWNYLHNDASASDNPDVGSGSAVATGVTENMSAPLGAVSTTGNFTFSDTVTANNAATVTDSATLDCGNKNVELTLVPGSVHTLTAPTGSWNDIADNSINSPLTVGNPTWGSGDQWGCWNYRILVIYEVKVTVAPPVQTPPTCNAITNDAADIESVQYTANSSKVTGFLFNLYNGSTASGTPVATSGNQSADSYNFTNLTAGQQYTVTATVLTSMGNVTGADCVATFTTPTTPPSTPPPATTTTTLPNTGPGSVVAIFVGATAAGTAFYNWFLKKRLAKQ